MIVSNNSKTHCMRRCCGMLAHRRRSIGINEVGIGGIRLQKHSAYSRKDIAW